MLDDTLITDCELLARICPQTPRAIIIHSGLPVLICDEGD